MKNKEYDIQSLPIKILSVFGGILASLAFLAFLLVTDFYESGTSMLVVGIICIAGAIWLNKMYDKIILDTLSVSFFIIGFLLIDVGHNYLEIGDNTINIIFFLIALGSLFVVQNYILSFISVLIIGGSLLALIISNRSYNLIHVYVSAFALIMAYWFLKKQK